MAAAAPWSVKGINPKAREVAKDLARRSGMTLGEWLNRVILEDDVPEEVTSEEHFGDRTRSLGAAPRPRIVSSITRLEGLGVSRMDELGRIALALDRLTDRIEDSETRTGLAISGVERSVRQAVARIEAAEHDHVTAATRFQSAVEQLGLEHTGLAERLRRMEGDPAGPRSVEALRILEESVARTNAQAKDGDAFTREALAALDLRLQRSEAAAPADPAALIDAVVGRLGQRLAEAEQRTTAALGALQGSFAELDTRLNGFEDGARADLDRRLDALGAQLAQGVEDARAEVAEKLRDAGVGQTEQRLAEMSAHVAAAEQRSTQAIERMGREVLMLAQAINRRVQSAEQRGAEAIEQVGGEVARIAGAMEARLGRSEQVHAEALERLGGEIGRITERLTERMMGSERRAAQAIDDVGEQVSRVTERMEQRHERASNDLAERIRQSEVRTSALLDEARDRIEHRLAVLLPETPAAPAPGAEAVSQLSPQDLEERFAPIPEADDAFDLDLPEMPEAGRPLSTREVIDQARAAARAAGETPRIAVQAGASWRAAAQPPIRRGKARPALNSSLQTAFLVAGGAAFLSVGAAGFVLMEAPRPIPEAPAVAALEAPPRAAIALAPQALGPVEPVEPQAAGDLMAPAAPTPHTSPAAAPARAPAGDYAAVTRAVEAGEPGALGRLKALAESGDRQAQIYLGKAYEGGLFGMTPSLVEARRWTTRAAEAGEPSAMHNLALYYFAGDGGPKDLPAAARWFRKAADHGVVDSQYNLGLLYQSGSGVGRDLAEAYKWYSIAASGGDAQARSRAVEVETKLSPAQVAGATAAAGAFHPGAAVVAQAATPRAASVAAAQRILGRLGYYKGPADGVGSPAFQVAVAAYQHDQGLKTSGALDPGTLSRLSVFSR